MEKQVCKKKLCFIVGAPRSGTTWLNKMLLENPAICGGEESYFFYLFNEFERSKNLFNSSKPVGPYCYFDEAALARKTKAFWHIFFEDLYAQHPDSTVHVEKTPFHAQFLDAIAKVFPTSKVIFLKRDSRAVVSSMLAAKKSWGSHWAPTSAKDAAIMWHQHVRAVHTWRTAHPDHAYMEIKYEDLIKPDSKILEDTFKFILESTDRAAALNDIRRKDVMSSTEPEGFARKRGADGWTSDMNRWQKLVVWRYTRKLMKDIGYEITPFS